MTKKQWHNSQKKDRVVALRVISKEVKEVTDIRVSNSVLPEDLAIRSGLPFQSIVVHLLNVTHFADPRRIRDAEIQWTKLAF